MKKEINEKKIENKVKSKFSKCSTKNNPCSPSGVYCLGFIGALVYYIANATGFWNGVLGVLKALVWSAFLVYGLMKFLAL